MAEQGAFFKRMQRIERQLSVIPMIIDKLPLNSTQRDEMLSYFKEEKNDETKAEKPE